jgi:prepilin-type N-terminal cleavage/methylation domain-containing protein
VVRHAFTMIELIFALVIMGIVFVSLPLILLRNADALEDNLIQESIFLASAKMTHITSFQWDNNSSESGMGTVSTSDVVDVSLTGAPTLNRNASDFRVGHFREDKHRRMSPNGNPRSATSIGNLGREGTVYDDIDDFDDFNNTALIVSAGALTSDTGYKKAYRIDVTVSYVDDDDGGAFFNGAAQQNFTFTTANPGGTTNLKMIEVSIDQNDTTGWTQTLLLRSYAANIGETDYYKRRY